MALALLTMFIRLQVAATESIDRYASGRTRARRFGDRRSGHDRVCARPARRGARRSARGRLGDRRGRGRTHRPPVQQGDRRHDRPRLIRTWVAPDVSVQGAAATTVRPPWSSPWRCRSSSWRCWRSSRSPSRSATRSPSSWPPAKAPAPAAVTTDMSGAATAAARRAVDLPIEVSTSSDGTSVTVSVTYVDPTDVAIIGPFIGPITHRASVTMALEPP